ncbi:hypothetical protein BO86DRAFT_161169 [Aspergillus japonicus CBS 114.51]|uniref:Uncharacterized protein n=1 Tax=Aspergillus japonicus CBS 114.51 TaxID=1448312 RepID=A0A8T8XC51_ASPJA|nr:hypothetical protein BO86DRAFT_161169 [Aspergillus japonicus CBS 114.51]RAH85590.1 hypothetical protein BO86DRAFT_161169 [Aspergillus japonicus CBS 114.51]
MRAGSVTSTVLRLAGASPLPLCGQECSTLWSRGPGRVCASPLFLQAGLCWWVYHDIQCLSHHAAEKVNIETPVCTGSVALEIKKLTIIFIIYLGSHEEGLVCSYRYVPLATHQPWLGILSHRLVFRCYNQPTFPLGVGCKPTPEACSSTFDCLPCHPGIQ